MNRGPCSQKDFGSRRVVLLPQFMMLTWLEGALGLMRGLCRGHIPELSRHPNLEGSWASPPSQLHLENVCMLSRVCFCQQESQPPKLRSSAQDSGVKWKGVKQEEVAGPGLSLCCPVLPA